MQEALVDVTPIRALQHKNHEGTTPNELGRTPDTGTSVTLQAVQSRWGPNKEGVYTRTGGTPTGHWKNNHTLQDATLGAKQLTETTEGREPTRLSRALEVSKALETNMVKKP